MKSIKPHDSTAAHTNTFTYDFPLNVEELRAWLQLFVMPIMNTEDDSATCRLFVLPVSEPDLMPLPLPLDPQRADK